jgi:hypothetical protein
MKFKFHRIIIKEFRRIMGLGQLEKKVNKTSFEWGKTKQNKETKKKKTGVVAHAGHPNYSGKYKIGLWSRSAWAKSDALPPK